MKRKSLFFCLVSVLALLVSCEKAYILDEEADSDASLNGQMLLRTSAKVSGNADETDYVSYPVKVYVMNSDAKCVSLSQISSSDEELSIGLKAGTYDVYAVSGTDNYDMPTAANASKSSVIAPKTGFGHGDLMTAYNSVVMAQGEENHVTLQMQRRVMQVESIAISNIPEDVTAVQLTLSPLYKSLQLNGDYTGGTTSHTFDLVKQSNGVWKNSESEYLLEAQDNITLKVSLTREDGVTSYSYACEESLSANYKINITGTFVSEEDIALSGTIQGTDWAGTVDITFDLDEASISQPGTTEPEEPEENEVLYGGAPAVGTLYKGCFVLRATNSENSTTVTLITPTEQNKIKVSQSQDEENVIKSIKENTDFALSNISVSGVSGWRLPTEEEMQYIDNNLDAINEKIEDLGSGVTTFVEKKGAYYCGYFFNASDGNVYVYTLSTGEIDKKPGNERATYKVRGFATLTFTE